MITDDPGTPGNGKWENNLSIAFSHVPNEWSIDAPGIDLNYGWGDHIQLTLQGGPALLKRSDHGLVGGIGGTEAAVKWRFLEEVKSGVDVSMFPRIIFNVLHSSVRRGLAEDGTRFQIPFQAAKKLGRIDLDVEFGPLISSVGRGELIYGIVAGTEVTKTTSVMAEVHATSGMNFTRDVVTLNFGWRQNLTNTQSGSPQSAMTCTRAKTRRSPSSATAGCSSFTDWRRSMRFGGRLLAEDQDQGDDHHEEHQRRAVATK